MAGKFKYAVEVEDRGKNGYDVRIRYLEGSMKKYLKNTDLVEHEFCTDEINAIEVKKKLITKYKRKHTRESKAAQKRVQEGQDYIPRHGN